MKLERKTFLSRISGRDSNWEFSRTFSTATFIRGVFRILVIVAGEGTRDWFSISNLHRSPQMNLKFMIIFFFFYYRIIIMFIEINAIKLKQRRISHGMVTNYKLFFFRKHFIDTIDETVVFHFFPRQLTMYKQQWKKKIQSLSITTKYLLLLCNV